MCDCKCQSQVKHSFSQKWHQTVTSLCPAFGRIYLMRMFLSQMQITGERCSSNVTNTSMETVEHCWNLIPCLVDRCCWTLGLFAPPRETIAMPWWHAATFSSKTKSIPGGTHPPATILGMSAAFARTNSYFKSVCHHLSTVSNQFSWFDLWPLRSHFTKTHFVSTELV